MSYQLHVRPRCRIFDITNHSIVYAASSVPLTSLARLMNNSSAAAANWWSTRKHELLLLNFFHLFFSTILFLEMFRCSLHTAKVSASRRRRRRLMKKSVRRSDMRHTVVRWLLSRATRGYCHLCSQRQVPEPRSRNIFFISCGGYRVYDIMTLL